MSVFNAILNAPFDLLFGSASAWAGFVIVCLLSTILVLLIFKFTSNQRLLRRRKDIALARLLEFVLFKDDIVVNLGAFGRVMAANLAYLGVLMLPLLLSLVPMLLILIQLSCWFELRPLRPGETTVLTAQLQESLPVTRQEINLVTSSGFSVEGEPVRAPSQNEISWKLRVTDTGTYPEWADVTINGQTIRKSLASGTQLTRVSSSRPRRGFFAALLNPSEDPLPLECPVISLYAPHPAAQWKIGNSDHNWIVTFCILSLILGIVLLKPLKVEV